MAFLIRRISLTADGREIIRDTPVDTDSVTIGRAAENAIALPDLAVDPQHACITRENDHHITITALGSLGFTVDGKTKHQCAINPAKGTEIGLGGHRIAVSLDPHGAVVLTVQRAAAASNAERDRDEARAFSLKGLLPGKRLSAWVLVIAVLGAFLALPVWAYFNRDQRSIYAAGSDKTWSSGPLSTAHHALEGKCESCHTKAFVSVRDESCVACHKDVHDHAPPVRMAGARAHPDFGGRILASVATAFGKPGAGACVDCHTEHEGAGPLPPTPQAFCADCHGTLKQRLRDTKLANAADFGTAHPQFEPLVSTAPAAMPKRVSLDAKPFDSSGLKFPHKLHLDPRSGVSRMAQTLRGRDGFGKVLVCADCHTPTADGTRFLPVDMEADCKACHSLAFDRIGGTVRTLRHGDTKQMIADLRALYRSTGTVRPPDLGGMARRRPGAYAEGQLYNAYFGAASARPGRAEAAIRAVFSKGGACFDCHTITPPGVRGASDWTVTPVHQPMRYMMKGWFDHAAHRTETCASCHSAAKSSQASDLLLPGIKTCRTCHAGESAKAKVPSGCAMCHSYHAATGAPWAPRRGPPPATNASVTASRKSGD